MRGWAQCELAHTLFDTSASQFKQTGSNKCRYDEQQQQTKCNAPSDSQDEHGRLSIGLTKNCQDQIGEERKVAAIRQDYAEEKTLYDTKEAKTFDLPRAGICDVLDERDATKVVLALAEK